MTSNRPRNGGCRMKRPSDRMKRPSDKFVENAALVLGWAGFLLVALIKWAGLQ